MNESSLRRYAPDSNDDQDPAATLAAVAARGTRVETPCGDGHMGWRRWGKGPPVMLIHGGSGSWSHWIRNVEALSEQHAVWALDLPGFGESAVPGELSIEAIAAAVEQGMHELIPGDSIDIIAFSFGSVIATMIAARLESRLRNLVLIGARFTRYSKRVNLHMVKWKNIADPAERLAAHRSNLEIMMIADPKNIDELAVHLQSTNTERTRVSTRKWNPGAGDKLHEYFPRVCAQGQVAVIFGRLDKGSQTIINNQGSALLADQPGVKFVVIENAGHWVQYEAAEQVNKLLLDVIG